VGEVGSMEVRMRGIMREWYFEEDDWREVMRAAMMPRMDCLRRYSSQALSHRGGSMLMIISAKARIYDGQLKVIIVVSEDLHGAPSLGR